MEGVSTSGAWCPHPGETSFESHPLRAVGGQEEYPLPERPHDFMHTIMVLATCNHRSYTSRATPREAETDHHQS